MKQGDGGRRDGGRRDRGRREGEEGWREEGWRGSDFYRAALTTVLKQSYHWRRMAKSVKYIQIYNQLVYTNLF